LDLSFGLLPQRQSFVGAEAAASGDFSQVKVLRATRERVLAQLAEDFATRQCQVTGRLSREWYAEACRFDGPDPDMPVVGTAKYLAASSNLFRHAESRCDLLGVGYVEPPATSIFHAQTSGAFGDTFVVLWRIEGTVNLPWHPTLKPYYGATFFWRDSETGLLVESREYWSLPAVDAFLSAAPGFGDIGESPAPSARELLVAHAAAAAAEANAAAHHAEGPGDAVFDLDAMAAAVGKSLLMSIGGVPLSLVARTRFVPVPVPCCRAGAGREANQERERGARREGSYVNI
jgi:hypothetical protein